MKMRGVPILLAGLIFWAAAGTAYAAGGDTPDLAVRGVAFTPARAHPGDVIRITVLLRNLGFAGDPVTIFPRVLANGKTVDSQVFTFGGDPQDTYTVTFRWDTTGTVPGEYAIQADFSNENDPTPFNNQLTLKTPLILVLPGAPFPDGQPAGGTVKFTDPAEKEWWDR